MISRRSLLISAFVSAFLLGVAAEPRSARADETKLSDTEAGDFLQKVSEKRNSLSQMKARFTEVRTLGLLASKVRSEGSLAMDRAKNVLEWSIEKPDPIVYRVGPEGLSYKSATGEGRASAATPKISNALSDLRSLLGGALSDLRARYHLAVARVNDAEGTHYQIVADARDPANAAFVSFSVTLDSDLVTPRRARLIETKRDFADITFSNVQWANTAPAR